MIRRIGRALLEEADLPPEIREIFFPAPPERTDRPPAPPSPQSETPARASPIRRERTGPEAASLERIESRFDAGVQERTRRPPASVDRLPRTKVQPELIREMLQSTATLRQAIVVHEILGSPKSLQPQDREEW